MAGFRISGSSSLWHTAITYAPNGLKELHQGFMLHVTQHAHVHELHTPALISCTAAVDLGRSQLARAAWHMHKKHKCHAQAHFAAMQLQTWPAGLFRPKPCASGT